MCREAFPAAGVSRTREDPVLARQQCQRPPQFRLPTAPSEDVVCESKHAGFAGWNQTLLEGVSVAEHSRKGHQAGKTCTETHSGMNCRCCGENRPSTTQILPKACCRRMNVPKPVPAMAFPGRAVLVHCERSRFGLGGRGWTERSEGSPGFSSGRSPTPATPKHSSREGYDTGLLRASTNGA